MNDNNAACPFGAPVVTEVPQTSRPVPIVSGSLRLS